MALIVLTLLTAFVAAGRIQNGLGNCLSYQRGPGNQASGQLLLTIPCNANDTSQINWMANNVTSLGGSSTTQWCVNGTNFCAGILRNRMNNDFNLVVVANDPTDDAQQWFALDTTTLPNHYVNGYTGGCAQAISNSRNQRRQPKVSVLRCTNLLAQVWFIVP